MMRVVAVVEGPGDVEAVPTLVAKAGGLVGLPSLASKPIKAGEWKKLRRDGEFERTLTLAATRNWDLILVILDLDDDCPVEESAAAYERIAKWRGERKIRVEVVFLAKEYETLFLHCPDCMGNADLSKIPENPDQIRGAKEKVKLAIGRRYRETQDQIKFTQALDMSVLYEKSRAFRRLCKAITGLDYDMMPGLV